MSDPTSMRDSEEDVADVALATQRRPDFVAEALSPPIRIGLLLLELFTSGLLVALVFSMAIWNSGLLAVNEFAGVLAIGCFIGLTFLVFLVFGALLGNNPTISSGERLTWYILFAIAGPVALPAYWFIQVWPAKYEPVVDESLAPARGGRVPPPYKREENETRVLPRYS